MKAITLGMANAYSIIIEIRWDVLYAKSTSTRLLEHRLFYANVKKNIWNPILIAENQTLS